VYAWAALYEAGGAVTEFEVILLILLAFWAQGKILEIIQHFKPERPRPEPFPQLPKTTEIELFGGIQTSKSRRTRIVAARFAKADLELRQHFTAEWRMIRDLCVQAAVI
jgi:hypothetical protein